MTKEEALKILRKDLLSNLVDYYSSEELQDAIDTIVSQPSLPSDLDEAAEKEIERFCSDMLNVDIWARMLLTKRFGLQMAKFGAEWMAGQGETRDDIVVTEGFDNKAHIFPIPSSKFNPGDKVVVQIRKKQ